MLHLINNHGIVLKTKTKLRKMPLYTITVELNPNIAFSWRFNAHYKQGVKNWCNSTYNLKVIRTHYLRSRFNTSYLVCTAGKMWSDFAFNHPSFNFLCRVFLLSPLELVQLSSVAPKIIMHILCKILFQLYLCIWQQVYYVPQWEPLLQFA